MVKLKHSIAISTLHLQNICVKYERHEFLPDPKRINHLAELTESVRDRLLHQTMTPFNVVATLTVFKFTLIETEQKRKRQQEQGALQL